MSIDHVRAVADAVLYEGYVLYPYRASSSKNQSRFQFGVLGPPKAHRDSYAESPTMSMQCVVRDDAGLGSVTVHVRFLQMQTRHTERLTVERVFELVDKLTVDGQDVLSWDEAVECEKTLPINDLAEARSTSIEIPGGEDVEEVHDSTGAIVGRIVRQRKPLSFEIETRTTSVRGFTVLTVTVHNTHPDAVSTKSDALHRSMVGSHVLLQASNASFVSVLDPPVDAADVVSQCEQQRCWPVLAGSPGSHDVMLGSPIILYDYPEIAEQSRGAFFDSTEIDELLTLRVMTLTDEEKAEASATDPRARDIIDRCDQMSDDDLFMMHGVLRDPYGTPTGSAEGIGVAAEVDGLDRVPEYSTPDIETNPQRNDVPWWSREAETSVSPDTDCVVVDGVPVARGSTVRIRPKHKADAQDMFFDGREAWVTSIHFDVDGHTHVGVVLTDDPAAELLDSYGRSLYFAPDEVEPAPQSVTHREEK